MFRKLSIIFLIVGMLCVVGCAAHVHKVGEGAQGSDMITARQWYILWGVIPLNHVDTNAMAGEATDYEIMTAVTPIDLILNTLLSEITVHCRTVTVQK